MKESNKIEILENFVDKLWEELETTERVLKRAEEYGLQEEVEIFKEHKERARSRWATANRMVKFLNGEIKEEEL